MPIHPDNRGRYPADWKAISLRIRFERAGGRCEFTDPATGERCTALHGEPHPITGSKVVLTTAHLNHQPEDCDDGNLKAGCQRCHLAHDREHHATTRREAEICKWARGQLTQMARTFLDEDEENGRDVVAYVGGLMDSGTLWVDRRR